MTPKQCRMARAALEWTVRELAQKAGVMPNTVTNLEKGRGTNTATVEAIESAFLTTGRVTFIGKDGVSVKDMNDEQLFEHILEEIRSA